jgi:hypothetical protein
VGEDKKGASVFDVLASRSAEAKKLSDAAKKDGPTMEALVASIEDLQKEYKAAVAGDKVSKDPSAKLFTEIVDISATQRLEQLFPAVVAFLLVAEVLAPLPPISLVIRPTLNRVSPPWQFRMESNSL